MVIYKEKRLTEVNGEKINARVSVIFYHGYAGCGPYARVTFPDGGEYSIDQATLAEHFEQEPDQHIVLNILAAGPFDRT